MGLYVEVTCDLQLKGHKPGDILTARCLSDRRGNPQGPNVGMARQEARKQGWRVDRSGYAVCPGCLGTEALPPSDQPHDR